MSKGTFSHTELHLSTYLFFNKRSQYLASNSGDLLEELASFVTALLLINLPQACKHSKIKKSDVICKQERSELGLHSDAV